MGPSCIYVWVGFLAWPSKVTFEACLQLTKYVFVPNSTLELHQWKMYLGLVKDNVPGLRQTYILHKLFWALNTNFVHNLLHPKLIGGTVKDCLLWGKWQRWWQVWALKRTECILTTPQHWTQGKEFERHDNSLLQGALLQPLQMTTTGRCVKWSNIQLHDYHVGRNRAGHNYWV
jgi:hypothetical protein